MAALRASSKFKNMHTFFFSKLARGASDKKSHPGGCHGILAGKKYFRYLEKGGFGGIVSNHL